MSPTKPTQEEMKGKIGVKKPATRMPTEGEKLLYMAASFAMILLQHQARGSSSCVNEEGPCAISGKPDIAVSRGKTTHVINTASDEVL